MLVLVAGGMNVVRAVEEERADRKLMIWPVSPDSMVFSLSTVLESIYALDEESGEELFNYRLESRGLAYPNAAGALVLGHGTMVAPGQGPTILSRVRESKGLSLQVFLAPPRKPCEESSDIVSFASSDGPCSFSLSQHGRKVTFLVRIDGKERKVSSQYDERKFQQIAVTWDGVSLILYVNGERKARSPAPGSPHDLASGDLVFGSGTVEKVGWAGLLEGFAFHQESLSAGDIAKGHEAYRNRIESRPNPEVVRLRAKLITKSEVSSPEDIAPYRESLAVFEYEVLEVHKGLYFPKKIRVVHWVILDGASVPFGRIGIGEEVELSLTKFEESRQLSTVNLSDTLDFDFDLDLFFDAGDAALIWGK